MEHSFLVTLLSNVKSFSENAMSSFRTVLRRKVTLEGEWEVGLTEVSFTKSWFNLPSNQEIFLFGKDALIHEDAIVVPQGFYQDIETLLTMINKKVGFFKDRVEVLPHFSFISHSKKVVLILGSDKNNNKVNVRLGFELQELLGFRKDDHDKHYRKYGSSFKDIETEEKHSITLLTTPDAFAVEASTPVDLRAGVHSLFLYTDIIEPNIVGDVYAQLHETVTIPNHSTFGDQCVISYENPKFRRLLTNEFESIKN